MTCPNCGTEYAARLCMDCGIYAAENDLPNALFQDDE